MNLRERASRQVDFSRDHIDRGSVTSAHNRSLPSRKILVLSLATLLILPVPAFASDEEPPDSTTTSTTTTIVDSTTTTLMPSSTTTTVEPSTTTSVRSSTTTTQSSTTTTVRDSTTTTVEEDDDPLIEEFPEEGEFLPLPSISFPVVGRVSFRDTYGAPRDGGARLHNGTDILAERGTPVVAVAGGVVERMGEGPDAGLYVVVRHSNGWRSAYAHLNNDSPGTDNGLSVGFGPGIEVGAQVRTGTLLGWVGDSGNAEETTPHLHFELHQPDGLRPNPYPALLSARRLGRYTTLDVVDYDDVESFNAELVSHLFLFGGFNTDIAVVDDHAYIGTWGNSERCPGMGVRVVDIANPDEPSSTGAFADHNDFPGTAAQTLWVGNVANENFQGRLGIVGLRSCASVVAGPTSEDVVGFALYDLSDPTAPELLAVQETGTEGVSHLDVSVTPDRITVAGLITLPSSHQGEGGELVGIYDVTDPGAPETLSILGAPQVGEQEDVADATPAGGTVAWSSWSQLEVTSKTGAVMQVDVSDLTNPVITAVEDLEVLALPASTEEDEEESEPGYHFTQRQVDIGPLGSLTASMSDGALLVDQRADGLGHVVATMVPAAAFDPQLWWAAADGTTEFPMAWDVSARDGLVFVSDHHSGIWVFRLTVGTTGGARSLVAN